MLAFLSNGPRFHFCLSPFFVAVMKCPMTKAPCRKKGLFRAYNSIGIGVRHHHAREHGGAGVASGWQLQTHPDPQTGSREHWQWQDAFEASESAQRYISSKATPPNPSHTFSPTGDQVFEPIGAVATQSITLLCSFSGGSESGREVGCFTLDITRSH